MIWVQVEQRGVKKYPTDLSVSDDAIISGAIRKCLVEDHLKQTVSPCRVKVLFEGAEVRRSALVSEYLTTLKTIHYFSKYKKMKVCTIVN